MAKVLCWVWLFPFCWGCYSSSNGVEQIIIKGSDTEVNVALVLAETYMEKEPNVSIAVTGGGSGTGIAALLSGKTHIANASRPMTASELAMARSYGIRPLPLVFAMDALAIVVNKSNPTDSLTMGELGRIFRGDLNSWAAVGGDSVAFSLYGRQSNSGTFLFFREKLLGADYTPALKQMNGTAQIVEAISTDPAGIGYVGVGYLSTKEGQLPANIKVLKISEKKGGPAYSPLDEAQILSGHYPVIRPLYQFIDGEPNGRLLDFLLYSIGEKGQKIVRENGYYPISEQQYAEDMKLMNVEMVSK
ncbi:MAG: PstS family phosphate ABC transporter substrate-binding protein [Lewinellaceae bacterium]|jgi:phosphate transport system substrate-binding protein|nr:PstS family phosphate ABC transporter substrate-binding protein [Lewinellaceae bacterium]